MTVMRAIGYIRVSTENQNGADTFGLETQRDCIKHYCEANELNLIGIYEDPAVSGNLQPLERPGLKSALEMLKNENIEQFIVTRLDRLARDAMLALWLEKEIRKTGAELISVSEPYRWQDPTQKLLLTMVAAFAEFERSLITTRLSSGRKTKARQGGYAGGKAPIGYKEIRGSKALAIDEEKAVTVRKVFELRDAHPESTLESLAAMLNDEGYTTKTGKRFYPMQVKRILDRRALYEGKYLYAGIESEGQHNAIL